MSDANFAEIVEKWPDWKSEEYKSFRDLLEDDDLEKALEEALKKEADEELKKTPALVRLGLSSGLLGLGAGLAPKPATTILSDAPLLNDIKKKLREPMEERFYAERLVLIKNNPVYQLLEKNADFRRAQRWIKDSRDENYKGAKAEFRFNVSVFLQLANYISRFTEGSAPQSLSKNNVRKIITASENLRAALAPCADYLDVYKYEKIMTRILLRFEDALRPKLQRNKTRQDGTALERNFVKGIMEWLFIYFGDASPKLVYILAGIIQYDITERNLAKQIAKIKKDKKETYKEFSSFSEAVHAKWY